MFNHISWQGYWTSLALLLTAYYLAVYLLYFRNDFQLLRGRRKSIPSLPLSAVSQSPLPENNPPSANTEKLTDENPDFQLPPLESMEYIVYACIDELTAFFDASKSSKCNKPELLNGLQQLLGKYPQIKTSHYNASLTGIIKAQCEADCAIRLSAAELEGLWRM